MHVCVTQLKDFAAAIRDYSKALQVDPANAYAFYNRGISHDRGGDFNKVCALSRRLACGRIVSVVGALALARWMVISFVSYPSAVRCGVSRRSRISPQPFISCHTTPISIIIVDSATGRRYGVAPEVCLLRGGESTIVGHAQGDYDAAIDDYSRALRIDPKHFKAVYNRGFSYDKVRQRQRPHVDGRAAGTVLERGARTVVSCSWACSRRLSLTTPPPSHSTLVTPTPSTTAALVWTRCVCLTRRDEDPEPFACPTFLCCLTSRYFVGVDAQMGRIEDAIADYSKAIELDPRNASSFNSRGLALDRCVCPRGSDMCAAWAICTGRL